MNITVEKLNKSFGKKQVLRDFSAVFPENKISCVMGPSGCGKTTLFRILLGLEKADSGTISGIPSKVSAVFQEDRLCQEFSAIENIKLVTGKNIPDKKIHDVLSALGLTGSTDIPVSDLSGGMQRRVSIARAVLYTSSLILLDEPFKGLDEETKETAMELVCTICKNHTVIFITHDQYEADSLAESIIRMNMAQK